MNIKSQILVLTFILNYSSAFAISDSLNNSKIYFQFPINIGLSFGKNQYTYGNGGRLAQSLGLYYKKSKIFSGIEIYKTGFKDINNQNEKFGSLIKIKAVNRINVVSAIVGRTIGSKQNFSLSAGIGYLTFRHPIIKYRDTFFSSYDYISGYDSKKSVSLNSTFKVYLNKKRYQTFAQISLFTSKQINFVSLSAGVEIKLKSGVKSLFDIY